MALLAVLHGSPVQGQASITQTDPRGVVYRIVWSLARNTYPSDLSIWLGTRAMSFLYLQQRSISELQQVGPISSLELIIRKYFQDVIVFEAEASHPYGTSR